MLLCYKIITISYNATVTNYLCVENDSEFQTGKTHSLSDVLFSNLPTYESKVQISKTRGSGEPVSLTWYK